MRSIVAVFVPVLAGALVYLVLALGGLPRGSMESSILLLPALLIGVMLVALVFLPLWSLLVHRTRRIRLAFVCVAAAILAVLCVGLTAFGTFKSSGFEDAALLLVPGLVLVMTFGMLMDPRRVRGGEKRPLKKAAGIGAGRSIFSFAATLSTFLASSTSRLTCVDRASSKALLPSTA
jgi:hypothetical protein